MTATAKLSPASLATIRRLDLRARMVVRGFLQGLHASPTQGFSVQFSDHRRYVRGDDPKLIDWLVYAKTDKHYVKRFEAETNLTGYLVMDLSGSMAFAGDGEVAGERMSKFEYATCLAAALTYLMTMQQDPVGLLTFGQSLAAVLPARSRRGQMGDVLAALSRLAPAGGTDLARCLGQVAAMLKQHSLVMLFSDLLGDADELLAAIGQIRHGGHDVIVFHILAHDEVTFPFDGPVEFEDPETGEVITAEASAVAAAYTEELEAFRSAMADGLAARRVDYVPLDTSMPFDTALSEYLQQRQSRL